MKKEYHLSRNRCRHRHPHEGGRQRQLRKKVPGAGGMADRKRNPTPSSPVEPPANPLTLNHEEHTSVIRATVEQVKGRIPRHRRHSVPMKPAIASNCPEEAKRLKADALLVVTPYYNKNIPEGADRSL